MNKEEKYFNGLLITLILIIIVLFFTGCQKYEIRTVKVKVTGNASYSVTSDAGYEIKGKGDTIGYIYCTDRTKITVIATGLNESSSYVYILGEDRELYLTVGLHAKNETRIENCVIK